MQSVALFPTIFKSNVQLYLKSLEQHYVLKKFCLKTVTVCQYSNLSTKEITLNEAVSLRNLDGGVCWNFGLVNYFS